MARDFAEASSQYLEGSSPTISQPTTLAAWVYSVDTANGNRMSAFAVGDGDGNPVYQLHFNRLAAGSVEAYEYGLAFQAARASADLSVNTWHHVAGVFVSRTERTCYLDGGNKVTDTGETNTQGPELATMDTVRMGQSLGIRRASSDFWDGRVAECAAWSAELTDGEIRGLAAGYSPRFVRPSSLIFYAELIGTDDYDMVGGLTLTPSGTPTVAAHAPVYHGIKPRYYFVSAGGTTEFLNASGSITPTGAMGAWTVGKILSGSITPSATLIRDVSTSYSGAITPNGDLIRQVQTALSGLLVPSGTILKSVITSYTGVVAPNGEIIRDAITTLSGTIAPSGDTIKDVATSYSGSIAPSGTLGAIRIVLLSIAGSIAPSGDLIKQVGKILTGSITPTGNLIKLVSTFMAGNITPSGVATNIRIVLLSIAGSITPTSNIIWQVGKGLSGAMFLDGEIIKDVTTSLAGVITPSGALSLASSAITFIKATFKGMYKGLFKGMQ